MIRENEMDGHSGEFARGLCQPAMNGTLYIPEKREYTLPRKESMLYVKNLTT